MGSRTFHLLIWTLVLIQGLALCACRAESLLGGAGSGDDAVAGDLAVTGELNAGDSHQHSDRPVCDSHFAARPIAVAGSLDVGPLSLALCPAFACDVMPWWLDAALIASNAAALDSSPSARLASYSLPLLI